MCKEFRRVSRLVAAVTRKPWQNGSHGSFNGKLRDECLSTERFMNRMDAKILIKNWRRKFNEARPHSSLGNLTPVEVKQQVPHQTPA